jgi:hypothetical protein
MDREKEKKILWRFIVLDIFIPLAPPTNTFAK